MALTVASTNVRTRQVDTQGHWTVFFGFLSLGTAAAESTGSSPRMWGTHDLYGFAKYLSSKIVLCSQTVDLVRDKLSVVNLGLVSTGSRN